MCKSSSSHDHYILLTSDGSKTIYPNNSPSNFTNEIHPLELDPLLRWEMALHSVILPTYFNTVISEADYIDIYKGCVNGKTAKRFWFRIQAPETRFFNTLEELYNFIDYFLVNGIRDKLGEDIFKAFWPDMDSSYMLKWDKNKRAFYTGAGSRASKPRLKNLYKDNDEFDPANDCVVLQPCDKIRRVLGFSNDLELIIYDAKKSKPEAKYSNLVPEVGSRLIDGVLVYTSVVEPIRLNNQLINLLDMFTFTDRLGKPQNEPIYHTLKDTYLSNITLKFCDQTGAPLAIPDGYTLVTLHIRAK